MKKLLLTTVILLSISGVVSAQQKKATVKATKTKVSNTSGDVMVTPRNTSTTPTLLKANSNRQKLAPVTTEAGKTKMNTTQKLEVIKSEENMNQASSAKKKVKS